MKSILPLGIQDFGKLRRKGALYVDKTALIHKLITGSGEAFFLSRPRRFGKSLLCSTLGAIFEGRRELFGEYAGRPALAINSLNWEWKKHPVIRIDLNAGVYQNGVDALHTSIHRELKREARKLNIVLDDKDCISQFATLIETSYNHTGEGVVVIIDEYDKPLINTIDYPDVHKKIRNELKGFYGVLKSYDEYLQFVFITGVSKFSHVSIFSDLNHLTDLTLDPEYADICGMTQEELEQNFEPEIAEILQNTGLTREEYLEDLRLFYNGYRFSEKELKVYNSFGLLKHFRYNGKFQDYWYESGTPTFLINIIAKQKVNILGLNKLEVRYSDFQKYDIETMQAAPLLYQTGYLTISDYNAESNYFTLDYPNEEVRSCFAKSLLEDYAKSSEMAFNALSVQLPKALIRGEIDAAMETLQSFFASIPYDIIKESENYYETAVHLIFTMLGMNSRPEVRISAGRIGVLVETKHNVYCFEFKLRDSAEVALAQIDTKEYMTPWKGSGKKLFKVGVSIDLKKRNIGEWKCVPERTQLTNIA